MPTSHAAVRHGVSWGKARRAEKAFLAEWDRAYCDAAHHCAQSHVDHDRFVPTAPPQWTRNSEPGDERQMPRIGVVTKGSVAPFISRLAASIMLTWAVACSPLGSGSPLGDGTLPPPYDVSGYTSDDTADLPDHITVPLAGVLVEVLDGTKAGTVALSDANGHYRLPGMPAGPVQMRASKDGYDAVVISYSLNSFLGPSFTLPQPPHTLWGNVFDRETGAPQRVGDVIVLVYSGPNAGRRTITNQDGQYRLDDLVASEMMDVAFTKAGFQSRAYRVVSFRKNTAQDAVLLPN
jgi:hypothetical protein